MKAQGQRDLANTQPPSSGARRPAALCLSVSFLHLFPGEPHSVLPRAWDASWAGGSQLHHQVTSAGSATPALQAWAVAQMVSTGPTALSSCCPGTPEEGEPDSADLGKLHFFLQLALLSLLWRSQAVAWCIQLGRQRPCAFMTSLLYTEKGLGPVPKYPSALWRVVGLETSKYSGSLPVWGLLSTSVSSRNRML